ncbi:MAG: phosphatase PAP2 family protein [Salinarimonadaceae bacterium]|nr:MAG: phosphatase PAP2 family protein [Salinarimonadaceae bacterium]
MTARLSTALACCLVLFVVTAGLVLVPSAGMAIHELERVLLSALRTETGSLIGPDWLQEAIRDISALGSMTVSIGGTMLGAGYFALRGEVRKAAFLLAAITGAVLLSVGAKEIFARPRPDLFEHGTRVFTPSFPSAHAAVSAAVAAAFANVLAMRFVETPARATIFVACGCVAILIGASRIYLGVHWPTDVVAGWALGLAWALVCVPLIKSETRS